jgi:predicted metalloprotease with PDZ domain
LAQTAASYDIRQGRRWRTLSDTTRDPIIAARSPLPWASWQRSEDYYSEGQLVWLEIDTLIRQLSDESRSLDSFARAFFGMDDGSFVTRPYDFAEVVDTLGAIVDYDWTGFLTQRLQGKAEGAPLAGIGRGGYELVYRDTQSDFGIASNTALNTIDLMFSLGLLLSSDGAIQEVIWGSLAFEGGLVAGSTIVAVNGRRFTGDEIKRAISEARNGGAVDLLVQNGKRHRTVSICYPGGLRYPHLLPIAGTRRRLDDILSPR